MQKQLDMNGLEEHQSQLHCSSKALSDSWMKSRTPETHHPDLLREMMFIINYNNNNNKNNNKKPRAAVEGLSEDWSPAASISHQETQKTYETGGHFAHCLHEHNMWCKQYK